MPVFSLPYATDEKTVAILGDSGIILGLEDIEGCRWRWESNDPWSPSPPVRAVTGDRATAHGSWDATRFYGPRNPQFKGTVVAPTHAALHAAKQRLFSAVSVEPFFLRVIEPGFDRIAAVRREGEVLWTEMRNTIAATFSLSLFAPDPIVYTTLFRSATLTLSATSTLTNEGGLPMAPLLSISGPTEDVVKVRNQTTGRELVITNPSGSPVLGVGESLLIDMQRRRVVTGSEVSRRSWMTGQWWDLRPAGNVVSVTTHDSATPGVLVAPAGSGATATWREGWI